MQRQGITLIEHKCISIVHIEFGILGITDTQYRILSVLTLFHFSKFGYTIEHITGNLPRNTQRINIVVALYDRVQVGTVKYI